MSSVKVRSRFFVTEATAYPSDVSDFVGRHGDGVRDLALLVDDATAVNEQAMVAGAEAMPSRNGGSDRVIKGFGDTVHSLVERNGSATPATPRSELSDDAPHGGAPSVNLLSIDHCAVSVEAGQRERWARFYEKALGMPKVPGDRRVEVDGSAFTMSTVQVPEGYAALVLAEPTTSSRKSQIADYLDHFQGPGVHHIALSTDDIVQTVTAFRARGMQMLDAPSSYFETRGGPIGRDRPGDRLARLARLGILVDADEDGYLLQAFTPPIGDRPTTCFEIIQHARAPGGSARTTSATSTHRSCKSRSVATSIRPEPCRASRPGMRPQRRGGEEQVAAAALRRNRYSRNSPARSRRSISSAITSGERPSESTR